MIRSIILFSFMFSSIAWGSCPQAVQYFKKDEKVNCNVYAFSPEKHEEIIIKVKSYDTLKLYVDTQDELLNNKNNQIQNLNKLLEIKDKKEKMSDLEKIGYFLGGIAVMYFASKAAQGLD